MEQTCSAIEHEKTRLSLKDAFEDLFARYDREFEDEDEIDIVNLRVVRKGGFLAKCPTKEFGECYRKRSEQLQVSSDSSELGSSAADENDDIDEQVFERVCKRIKKSQAIARLNSLPLFDHTIHFAPVSVLCDPVKTDWRGAYSFDSVLFTLIRHEYTEEKDAVRALIQEKICSCNNCFSCILLKEMTD
jgi:Centromere protein Scm3